MRNEQMLPGQVVLVLQGGGALGAYQAGVYEALHGAGIEPDWVIGTSIGAINASLIAGNAPKDRLAAMREFWKRVAQDSPLASFSTFTQGIPAFFVPRQLSWGGVQARVGLDQASYLRHGAAARDLVAADEPGEAEHPDHRGGREGARQPDALFRQP